MEYLVEYGSILVGMLAIKILYHFRHSITGNERVFTALLWLVGAFFVMVLRRFVGLSMVGHVVDQVVVHIDQVIEPEKQWYDHLMDYVREHPYLTSLGCSSILWLWLAFKILFWIIRVWCRFVRRLILSFRGIELHTVRGESTRPGSFFHPVNTLPKGQVPIYNIGFLRNHHVGFGVRIGNYLVAPKHVIEEAGETCFLENAGGKGGIAVESVVVDSPIVNDLCYMDVPIEVWSKLGHKAASFCKDDVENIAVSCTGYRNGEIQSTSGIITKANYVGMLEYSGSTEPGMSGAPYVSRGAVFGIHSGATADYNVGYSVLVVLSDIARLVKNESRRRGVKIDPKDYLPAENAAKEITRAKKSAWTMEDVEDLKKGAAKGSWAAIMELDDYINALDESRKVGDDAYAGLKDIPVLTSVRNLEDFKTLTAKAQSPKQKMVEMSVDTEDHRYAVISRAFASLNERVSALESDFVLLLDKIRGVAQTKPKTVDPPKVVKQVKVEPKVNPEVKVVAKTPTEDFRLNKQKQKSRKKNHNRNQKIIAAWNKLMSGKVLTIEEAQMLSKRKFDVAGKKCPPWASHLIMRSRESTAKST